MAAGVNQVGGAGTDVRFDDVTHADAGGDSLYSWADIAAACVAKGFFAADGVTPAVSRATLIAGYGTLSREVFLTLVNVQQGDGVATGTVTILKDANVAVNFITGKTYIVSNVGLSNKTTEYGIEIPGAGGKPSSRSGVEVFYGASPTLRGIQKYFGCKFVSANQLVFQPAFVGSGSRIVNFIGECSGVFGFGTGSGEIDYMFNVDVTCTGAIAAAMTQFNCNFAERLVLGAPNATRIIATAGAIKARDVILVGNSGTTLAEFSLTGGTPHAFVDFKWSRANVYTTGNVGADVDDFLPFGIRVTDPLAAGAPLAGKDWRLKDKTGAVIWSGVTDSEGQVTGQVSSGISIDCVAARTMQANTSIWEDNGPFVLEVNWPGGPNYDPTRIFYSNPYTWPGQDYAYGRQLSPFFDNVPLGPPVSTGPPPTIEGLPLEVAGTPRIAMPIPSVA